SHTIARIVAVHGAAPKRSDNRKVISSTIAAESTLSRPFNASPMGVPFISPSATEAAETALHSSMSIEISILMLECNAVSAASVALGLMNGTPIGEALKGRDNVDSAAIVDEITFRLSDRFGAAPCTATMRAIVCE